MRGRRDEREHPRKAVLLPVLGHSDGVSAADVVVEAGEELAADVALKARAVVVDHDVAERRERGVSLRNGRRALSRARRLLATFWAARAGVSVAASRTLTHSRLLQ